MRNIKLLVIHCSATPPSADIGVKTIEKWHRARGFRTIGYHYVIRRDGSLENGRPEREAGAHVKGYNAASLGICLVGGVDERGNPEPNFTEEQIATLKALISDIKKRHNIRRICGHRDLSPDRDGDGIVEPHEWIKHCPCFDVDTFLRTGQLRDNGKLYESKPYA